MKAKITRNSVSTIGIWGAGLVGMSALRYYKNKNSPLLLYDHAPLSPDKLHDFKHVKLFQPDQLSTFLETADTIIPSPGIDTRAYSAYAHKWLSELDVFYQACTTPIIAVTGSVGKTSTVTALAHLLTKAGKAVRVGGNIGIGMLDLLQDPTPSDYIILEVSSFQLEYAKTFAPFLSIWTNCYPNHLDRHGTMDNYVGAKGQILRSEDSEHPALIHEQLAPYCAGSPYARAYTTFSATPEHIQLVQQGTGLHADHYALLEKAAAMLSVPYSPDLFADLELPGHRTEQVATVNGVSFYNDSKATIMQATLGALSRLQPNPTILFLGGLSKGVDRQPFFEQLPAHVKHIICFGAEADTLARYGREHIFSASVHTTLESAFEHARTLARTGDTVLFSPGGTSFDLFKDYQERGERFCALVKNL